MASNPRFIDHSGKQFGHWTVLRRDDDPKHRDTMFWCRCQCGYEGARRSALLLKGRTLSCGCRGKPRHEPRAENNNKRWTEEEIQRFAQYYAVNGSRVGKWFGRSREAARSAAYQYGIRLQRKIITIPHELWTEEEDQALRDHYPTGGAIGCLPYLPKRSKDAIRTRAGDMGIRYLNNPRGRKSERRQQMP